MAENREKLFDQFAPVSTETWKAKVVADLKGADFDKKLVWRTNEGFNVQPMYRAEDIENLKTTDSLPGEYPFVRGTRTDNEWFIRQNIVVENVAEANEKAKSLTTKGVTSFGFKLSEALTADNVATLLNGIDLAKVEVNFESCPKCAVATTKALVEYLTSNGKADEFTGSVKFDPFVRLLKHGVDFGGDIKAMAKELTEIVAPVKNLRVFTVDTVLLSDAGAYIAQELGYALAWGNEWMSQLTDAGVAVDEAAKRIKFNMGITSNYFMEIAKFRAARMLWAQIVKQYQPECDCACKMNVHAATTKFNQTVFDAHVNLLRTQTETMSAALAGVDSITVTPFDAQFKNPDEFSERIARNQQLLLKEESHLDKITDPAGGSYYVETLTASIADVAWKTSLPLKTSAASTQPSKKAKSRKSSKRHQRNVTKTLPAAKSLSSAQTSSLTSQKLQATRLRRPTDATAAASTTHRKVLWHQSRQHVRQATLRHSALQQRNRQYVRKYLCLQSATWQCALPAHSSLPTSSPAQVMKSSTTLVSRPSRKASTPLWKRKPTSWCSVQATTNTQNMHRKHSSCSTAAPSLL